MYYSTAMLWTLLFVFVVVEVQSIDVGDCICYNETGTDVCAIAIAKNDTDFTVTLPTGNVEVPTSMASLGGESACPGQCSLDVVIPDSSKCTANIVSTYTDNTVKAQIGGTCIYGLDHNLTFTDARAYCEDNGLKLVQLQDPDKQKKVFEATNWMQHWMHLEKISGTWRWGGAGGKAMRNARWEHGSDADTYDRAFTMTTLSQNKFLWKGGNDNWYYRPVCEGQASGCPDPPPSAGSCLCVNTDAAPAFPDSGGVEAVSLSTCLTATGRVRTGDLFGSSATLSFYEVNRPGLNPVWVLSTQLDAGARRNCTTEPTTVNANGCRVYFSESVVEAVVEGRCIFGINTNMRPEAARALCEDKGLRLAWVETRRTQRKITAATNFREYWIGLKLKRRRWVWISPNDDNNADASSDVVGRWDGESNNTYAFVQRSNLKSISNPKTSKRVVCQEQGETIAGPTIGTCMCITEALAPAFSFSGISQTLLSGACYPSAGSGKTGDFFGQTASTEFYELVRPGLGSVWVLSDKLNQSSPERCDTNILCTDETVIKDSDKCSTDLVGYSHGQRKAQFGSTCVYGLDHTLQYSDARAYCEDNGLRLVQLQDPQKQKKVFQATNWMQHWMHLEKISGTWRWGGAGGEAMTNARWEHGPDADTYDRAFTMTTLNQNKFLWKGGNDNWYYRPVCEGQASGCSVAPQVLSRSDCFIATGDVNNGTTFSRDADLRFFELTKANGDTAWVLNSDVDQSPHSKCGRFEKGDCLCTTGVATGVAVYGSHVTVSSYAGDTCYRATGEEVAGDGYGFTDKHFVALEMDTHKILFMEKSDLAEKSLAKCQCPDQTVYKDSARCTRVFQQSLPSAMFLTAKIGGRCVYGVESMKNYTEAKIFCEVNSLRLVRVKDDSFASQVHDGIGFEEYWVGLEKIDGTWTWVAQSTSDNQNAEGEIAGRWQTPSMAADFDRATISVSNGGAMFRLKGIAASRKSRVICEEVIPCSGASSATQFLAVHFLCVLVSYLVLKKM
ncbi:uncharacterized protein LOC124281794 isoform X2 [Haliotis rubra]|uniref:uncharacterized protein LOC124281794 isoform X2 n=1 Tax=Haliotis rubra TaxID=36100 RepID=UPI001EE56E1D|nr:uncharacterized protein LOC124281794 isoform X2 [Haliotis rubra]